MFGMVQISKERAYKALSQFESIKEVVSYGQEYVRAVEALEALVTVSESDVFFISDSVCHVIHWINEYSYLAEEVDVKEVCSDS